MFYAINQVGTVRFLDGQTGQAASFEGFGGFQFTFDSRTMMSMSFESALRKANEFLQRSGVLSGRWDIVIDPSATMETEGCWVFFFNTREFLETRSMSFALAGNAPIFVKKDGTAPFFGVTHAPIEDQIDDYGCLGTAASDRQ